MTAVIRGAGEPVAPGEPRIWDDAVTAQTFPGITSPLAFTLAAATFGRIGREYARSLGVPEDQVAQTDSWTPYLLGSFHGRVYANLLHWYRLAGIAPGYRLSCRALEEILGATDPVPAEIAEVLSPFVFDSRVDRIRSRIRTAGVFVHRALRIEAMMEEFRTEFDRICHRYEAVDYLHGEHAYAEYRRLDRELVQLWGPVAVLDAVLLTLMGAVVTLTESYLPEAPRSFRYAAVQPSTAIGFAGGAGGTGFDPEVYLDERLGGLRRRLYDLVRVRAARCIAHREIVRSSRIRAAGILEAMIGVMARDLQSRGILRDPDDIDHLTADELRGCYDRVPMPDLRVRIAARKAARVGAEELSAPVRFSTEGAEPSDRQLTEQSWSPPDQIPFARAGELLTGTGSAAGVVEGPAVVAGRRRDTAPGILVAERADPAWVAALPSASALVIEHGGPLTVVATAARELGIPTVVRVPSATAKLQTGMQIRVDGSAGTVTVLSREGSE